MFEVCDEAFTDADDRLCLPRQLAKMDQLDLGWILDELDECQRQCYQDRERSPFEDGQTWRAVGATPRMLLELARRWQYQCLVLHGTRALERYAPADPKGFWVATWWGSHVYCYESERAKRSLWRRGHESGRPAPVTGAVRLARIVQRSGEVADKWEPWPGLPWSGAPWLSDSAQPPAGHFWATDLKTPAGHFWATDLQEVRLSLIHI